MPVTTRKLGVSESGNGEFVVPDPHQERKGFLGVQSGARFETAAVSYIGREVSARDVADKFLKHCKAMVEPPALVRYFESYLRRLQPFKVGSVLRIEYLEGGDFNLTRVGKSPSGNRSRKLPE